jgi:hypothetical protein
MNEGAIVFLLCSGAIGLLLATLIGGVLLRAACALYNKFVGGRKTPYSVPEPEMGKAMGIIFVTELVNWILGLAIGFAIGAGSFAAGLGEMETKIIAQMVSFPFSLLVLAGMSSSMLPTTFGRGLLVALCYLLVVVFVAVVLGVIFGGLFLLIKLAS